LSLSSQKYGFGIRDPRSGIRKKSIPDSGASGSCFDWLLLLFLLLQKKNLLSDTAAALEDAAFTTSSHLQYVGGLTYETAQNI
jgi:hypothetical protein